MGPDAIWGQFNNYRSNGLVGSAVVHVVMLALILGATLFGHQVVQKAQEREVVTLIAPSPDSYALPVAKKVVSGGGGGGDHDRRLRCSSSRLRRSSFTTSTRNWPSNRRW
jgi:hypothetical protein